MKPIEKELKECISALNKEISILEKQKFLLESIDFETYKPNEKQWHELMETGIRYSPNIISILVKNIFPEAEEICVGANYVKFKLQGLNVGIATSRCMEAVLFENSKDKGTTFFNLTNEEIENVKNVIEKLESFASRIKIHHYYRDYYGRLNSDYISTDRLLNIMEQNKLREEEIER